MVAIVVVAETSRETFYCVGKSKEKTKFEGEFGEKIERE